MFLTLLFAAVIVQPVHPTWEHVLADRVLAPAGGGADDAPVIQRALDDVGERQGGGTVFLKPGVWTLKGPLVLPANTALKGDYAPRDVRRSTHLEVRYGKGDEKAASPVTLLAGSCLQGVWISYPDQNLDHPSAYPWTIVHGVDAKRRNAGCPDHQTVRDVTLANAWKGIRIGPAWNELHTLRDVRVTALAAGLFFDTCTDIGRLIDVTVAPEVWAESGLPNAPDRKRLAAYLKEKTVVAVEYGRSDWEYVWRLKVREYGVGLKFDRGVRGESNSVVAESAFEDCAVGLEMHAVNEVGLAVYDTVFARCGVPVHLADTFKTCVQFADCDLGGGRIRRDGKSTGVVISHPGNGAAIRHEPMIPPRPQSAVLVEARAFGLDAKRDDNADAIQRALDRAAALGGGTVYVPAGEYSLRHGVTVPTGVELRGSSAAPHHTCSGGSMLLVRYGRGDAEGEPTVRLARGSGLRGVTVWYPENPRDNPEPYPWAVRSLGEDAYLVDVCIANAWRMADFATHPSGGHRISYLSGNGWREGLRIGKSDRDGWVEETLLNPHYAHRLPKDLPFCAGAIPKDWRGLSGIFIPSRWMRMRFDAHQFEDCAREHVRGTFVYAAREGIAFRGKTHARIVMHGSDTIARGVEIGLADSGRVDVALAQLTPYETDSGLESAGFHFAREDRGTSTFKASQLWCENPTVLAEGAGTAVFACGNSISSAVRAQRGTLHFSDFCLANYDDVGWLEKTSAAHVTAVRSGGYPVDPALQPSIPPKEVTLDMVSSRPPENTLAWKNARLNVDDWSLVTTNGEARFTVRISSHAHAFVYPLFWKGETTVGPNTALVVSAKALNEFSTQKNRFSFDLMFSDGTVARENGGPVWIRTTRTDRFVTMRLPIRRHCRKTITAIMGRVDVRDKPGDYAMAFRDIRLVH